MHQTCSDLPEKEKSTLAGSCNPAPGRGAGARQVPPGSGAALGGPSRGPSTGSGTPTAGPGGGQMLWDPGNLPRYPPYPCVSPGCWGGGVPRGMGTMQLHHPHRTGLGGAATLPSCSHPDARSHESTRAGKGFAWEHPRPWLRWGKDAEPWVPAPTGTREPRGQRAGDSSAPRGPASSEGDRRDLTREPPDLESSLKPQSC